MGFDLLPFGVMFVAQSWLWMGLAYCAMSKATGSWKLT